MTDLARAAFVPLAFTAICFVCAGALDAQERVPNIVVIVADDLGYADVRFNPRHAPEIATPHLDALAKESVICRQGYVTGNVCSPTRTALMTGRYQQRLGLYTAGEAGSGVPMTEKIFPQFLAPAGYTSIQIGKWHLGPTPEWSPALRGFYGDTAVKTPNIDRGAPIAMDGPAEVLALIRGQVCPGGPVGYDEEAADIEANDLELPCPVAWSIGCSCQCCFSARALGWRMRIAARM